MSSPETDAVPRRNRQRRLHLIAGMTVAAAVLALWSLGQPWFTMYLAPTTVVDADHHSYTEVAAAGSITGWQIASSASTEPTPALGAPVSVPQPGVTAGMPTAAFLLVAGAAVGVTAMLLRFTLLAGVGILFMPMAWRQHGALTKLMLDPFFGGALNRADSGASTFQLALLATAGLLVVGAVQVHMVNSEARAEAKAEAKARGEAPKPGLLDAVYAMVLSQATRLSKGAPGGADRPDAV